MAAISTPQPGFALPVSLAADPAPSRQRRDLLEFWMAYALIALAIWTPLLWQRALSLVALAWVIWATVRSFDGWRAMGWRVAGFWRAAWVLPTAISAPHSPGGASNVRLRGSAATISNAPALSAAARSSR